MKMKTDKKIKLIPGKSDLLVFENAIFGDLRFLESETPFLQSALESFGNGQGLRQCRLLPSVRTNRPKRPILCGQTEGGPKPGHSQVNRRAGGDFAACGEVYFDGSSVREGESLCEKDQC